MSTLYLLNYNNYGNRIIKKESSLANYLSADTGYAADRDKLTNVNFYRGDGVNTRQTVDFPVGKSEKDADYLIVTDGASPENIVSRWFIIECDYNRRNQMILTLRRDLLVDFWRNIYNTNTEFFCEKGAVDISDDFIFNGENVTFNRKKSNGMVAGGSGYIVGYMDKGFSSNRAYYYRPSANVVNKLEDIPVYRFTGMGGDLLVDNLWLQYSLYMSSDTSASAGQDALGYKATINFNYNIPAVSQVTTKFYMGKSGLTSGNVTSFFSSKLTTMNTNLRNFIYYQNPRLGKYTDYSSENGKIYYVESLNTFYKVTIGSSNNYIGSVALDDIAEQSIFYSQFNSYFSGSWYAQPSGYGMISGDVAFNATYKTVTLVQSTTGSFTIPAYTDRKHTNKPYDIFVAEYNSTNLETASRIATALAGSGALIDLQRVPYMSANWNANDHSTTWAVNFGDVSATYRFIDFDEFSGTTTPIALTTPPTTYVGYTQKTNVADVKLDALSLTYRLTSPNHANAWDFSPALNRGCNAAFNYEVTLKPYQPYIHVFPTFNDTGIYGKGNDYDDRGIICMGSFSLAISSDAWQTYQINNASYQNAFDRQIENLNVTQDVQRTMEKWSIAAGAVSAATSGAIAGSAGGGVGAAVGGVVAGAASLAAGIADYQMNEKLRNEAIDYTKDQFGYQMQNIKAKPFTFSQSCAFDINNSTGVLIDVFEPTSDEKNAFKDKIKWNGMTVMKLGTFKAFWDLLNTHKTYVKYIKGKLVRCPNLKDDTHVFNEIANELYKGVYIN